MVRWSWVEWVIAGAAAALSLLAIPRVCGESIAMPVGTPVGAGNVAGASGASAKADPTAAAIPVAVSIGKLLLEVESGELSVRRASIEELSRSNDGRSIGALVAAMKDEDADTRRAAMLGLWRVG